VDLHAADADFAIGCGYKFLNGGPGAPAFVWAHPRCANAAQPLSGWIGHARPFDFATGYEAAAGIDHYLCGSPPILGLAALDCGVDSVLAAEPLGGMAALHAKAGRLGDLFIQLVEARCAGFGLELASPRDAAQRGSQVSLAHAHAWPVMQALIACGVIGDYRAGRSGEPDLLRFGFTPLYLRFVDVWNAVETLADILNHRRWDMPDFHTRKAVT
jgi:kynureninase